MQPQYITLITALTSAAVGSGLTLVGIYLTNRSAERRHQQQLRHEDEQRKQELLRARGEELYTVVSEWLKWMGTYQLRGMAVLYGTMTYNQSVEQQLADGKPPFNFDRIEMLIETYFPAVKTAYLALLAERENFNEMYMQFKHKYQQVGSRASDEQIILAHDKSVTLIDKLGETLKSEIVKSLRNIDAPP
jgi:hypothetical protein